MKIIQRILVFLFVANGVLIQAQSRTSKMVVTMGSVFKVTSDSLHIDTLIMQDDSRIIFLAQETKLLIEHAFIGKNCTWDASGQSADKTRNRASSMGNLSAYANSPIFVSRPYRRGQNPDGQRGVGGRNGADGQPGRNIQASVLFSFLGELTIDVSGGFGRMGSRGSIGGQGQTGSNLTPTGGRGGDGGMGGNGGNGGTISLSYACDGFTPVFNKGGFRSIYFDSSGGRGGTGGAPGKGGPGGVPKRTIDHANQVVEWDGRKGSEGGFGRMGQAGQNGNDGLLILNKLN